MVLKVDLQCPCCYKKVKKIICKFPQIRDQVYSEKENKVRITVVCCDPEKIRDKLCCKGAKVIKSIEIVDPPKPERPKPEKPKDPEKPKPEKPIEEPIKPPKPPSTKPVDVPKPDKPRPPVVPGPTPAPCPPRPCWCPPGPCWCPPVFPVRPCCGPCSQGIGGGPCNCWHRPPPPMPRPCFDGCCVYGCHHRPCHVTICDYYFSEENPQACSIM
ncbi:protein PYRICULARIA ORYZAE RESISTANCE 21-like [Salvia divinorum]